MKPLAERFHNRTRAARNKISAKAITRSRVAPCIVTAQRHDVGTARGRRATTGSLKIGRLPTTA